MAIPTKTNLETMDYAFMGQPFAGVAAKTGMNLPSMDYAFLGQPFVVNPDPISAGSVRIFGYIIG